MKYFWILSILFGCSSCQYFETEKISSDTFYEEEIKTIDWKDVDRYPAFLNCDTLSVKTAQKHCFEEELAQVLQQGVVDQGVTALRDLHDTIMLSFSVSENAQIMMLQMQMDSILQNEFPHLKDSLVHAIDALQLVAPAYKRGIPVKTQFTLPIIVKTEEL
ncbi:MAG: hypothetical protein R3359_08240 [Marinirhabdus sp.]|nr:hypothetical protein [Marinirhabdus sp.]